MFCVEDFEIVETVEIIEMIMMIMSRLKPFMSSKASLNGNN